MVPNQFNIVHKEVNSHSRAIMEAMFICVQDPPKQKPWKVPAAAHMEPPPPGISNPSVQPTNQPTLQPPNTTPYWFPLPSPSPTTTTTAGGTHNFLSLLYGKYTCIPNTPSLLIYNKSYTSAMLVSFLHFIC